MAGPYLRTGTFLRLIGMDLVKRKGAFETPITPIALPTGLAAAIATLGAAQYGPTKPSIMPYVGYELIIGQDLGADVSAAKGDTTKVWQTAWTGVGRLPDKINIPGRDTGDASLTLPGSENKIDTSAAPWVAFAAAMGDTHLLAPFVASAAQSFLGGVADASRRVKPKEVVRQVPTPIVIGGTRLKLYGVDNRGVVAASEFFQLSIVVDTAVVTAINALGAAIYGAVPGTTPLPSQMTYVGWEIVVSADAGYTGGGFGDSRTKWRVTANSPAVEDLRFSIPGRNDQVAALFQPGAYTLANFNAGAWTTWVAAMSDAHITAPLDQFGNAATMEGAIASNRTGNSARESIS